MSESGSDATPKRVSRRRFIATATAATATVAGAGIAYAVANPDLALKTLDSIVKGRAFEDFKEVVDSQFPKEERRELGEKIPYDSAWLNVFFQSMDFFNVKGQQDGRICFLDITNKAKILATNNRGADLSQAFGPIKNPFMTLPYPQNETDNNYLMYASFNIGGKNIPSSSKGRSPHRGGLLLQAGTIRVGQPGDFQSTDPISPYESYVDSTPNSAQVEYFFTLDSNTMQQDLEILKASKSLSGKALSNAQEFSAALVTFYSSSGQLRTFVMTGFKDLNPAQGVFVPPQIENFTIPQLTNLSQDYLKNHLPDFNRFIIAIPDPGVNQSLIHSAALANDQLTRSKLTPFRSQGISPEQASIELYHRTLGGNAQDSSTYKPYRATKPAYIVVGAP